jgi:hypothetical protein
MSDIRATGVDRLLRPVHRWVWGDAHRRAHKLLRFAQTEADGGRALARAAELTHDALLRRLYLHHAMDEQRHADLFRKRGRAMLIALPKRDAGAEANWLAHLVSSPLVTLTVTPGEHGLDDLRVESEKDDTLLAFLHLSERAAALRFAVYREVLEVDPETRDVFVDILRDEAFHMNYTHTQLKRVAPKRHGVRLWLARLHRAYKTYVRLSAAIASAMGAIILGLQYFVILPIFALVAKRAARREPEGWTDAQARPHSLTSQY